MQRANSKISLQRFLRKKRPQWVVERPTHHWTNTNIILYFFLLLLLKKEKFLCVYGLFEPIIIVLSITTNNTNPRRGRTNEGMLFVRRGDVGVMF